MIKEGDNILLFFIFILLIHLAWQDYKTKYVLVWEYVLLFILCVACFYDSVSWYNLLFCMIAFIIPNTPIADRFGLASLSFFSIHAVLLSVVFSLLFERLNITTAYFPSVLLSFSIVLLLQICYRTVGF